MQEFDWKWALTSFDGRLNRAPYWMATLTMFFVVTAVVFVSVAALPRIVGVPLTVLAVCLGFFINLALSIKRMHDRDMSGHWLWFFLGAPFLLGVISGFLDASGTGVGFSFVLNLAGMGISLWMLIEVGFLRGTHGPNQFGHDPLGGMVQGSSPVDRLDRLGRL